MCNRVADPRLRAAAIETLEPRRLLAAATGDLTWDFVDENGASHGTATLHDGVLTVTATDGDDEMTVGTDREPGSFYVMLNHVGRHFDLAAVRGVVIDAGAGNDCLDFFNFRDVLDLPVTVDGGAGNDSLVAQRDRNNYDDPIAFMSGRPFADTTLIGGAGDDDLHAGIGDCAMYGGPGNDTFERGWGHDKIRDPDAVNPHTPDRAAEAIAPTPEPAKAAELAEDDHASPAPPAPPTLVPPTFALAPVAMSDGNGALFRGLSDDGWPA